MRANTVIDPRRLRAAAGQAVGALKVLANADRLLLLCQFSLGEMCVSELEEGLDIQQPTRSQQLDERENIAFEEPVPRPRLPLC